MEAPPAARVRVVSWALDPGCRRTLGLSKHRRAGKNVGRATPYRQPQPHQFAGLREAFQLSSTSGGAVSLKSVVGRGTRAPLWTSAGTGATQRAPESAAPGVGAQVGRADRHRGTAAGGTEGGIAGAAGIAGLDVRAEAGNAAGRSTGIAGGLTTPVTPGKAPGLSIGEADGVTTPLIPGKPEGSSVGVATAAIIDLENGAAADDVLSAGAEEENAAAFSILPSAGGTSVEATVAESTVVRAGVVDGFAPTAGDPLLPAEENGSWEAVAAGVATVGGLAPPSRNGSLVTAEAAAVLTSFSGPFATSWLTVAIGSFVRGTLMARPRPYFADCS